MTHFPDGCTVHHRPDGSIERIEPARRVTPRKDVLPPRGADEKVDFRYDAERERWIATTDLGTYERPGDLSGSWVKQ